ncbi:MAG TPA: sugar nucleotide-binding protein [Thermoplasmata archaeon]|nr:sugar nucleotide-binding protein [Thermoplasmata archaeon]
MPGDLLVFGAGSLVGSDFVRAAAERYSITAAGRNDPRPHGVRVAHFESVDLTDESALRRFLAGRQGDRAWVNFAARTDVDGCESERPADLGAIPVDVARSDTAWRMNAEVPGWIAEAASHSGTPFIHLSTDFVFDGTHGPYEEPELPAPWGPKISWYGYTKGVGETRARERDHSTTIVRISYPYRSQYRPKPDFARNLLARARARTLYPLYTDQQITPTWIPDVSRVVETLVEAPAPGSFHVASPSTTTPWKFAGLLLAAFGLAVPPPGQSRLVDQPPARGRAPRPLLGGLRDGRAEERGIVLTDYRAGIAQMLLDARVP